MNHDDIIVAPSALKHGYDPADVRHALRHPSRPFATDDDDVTMIVGPARNAALVEVGFLISADDGTTIVAIHCMDARAMYLRRL